MATITVEGWQAIAGAVVIVLTVVFKFVLDLRRERRAREEYQERSANERQASEERLQVLRDIAATNAKIREGQVAQNGKLSEVVSVNKAHHEELIRALNATCKARPMFDQGEKAHV